MSKKLWSIWLLGLFVVMGSQVVAGTVYVNINAAGANNGTSWSNAFNFLQDAIADANAFSDDIWVAQGTYEPDLGAGITPGDYQMFFEMKTGLALYGGFAGTETELSQRDYVNNLTILSGDLSANDANDFSNRSDNSYRVVVSIGDSSSTILDGFTIKGGMANSSFPKNVGAGICTSDSAMKINNCIITDNWTESGGALWYDGGNRGPEVTNCEFTGNAANYFGAGYYAREGAAVLDNCTFTGNTSVNGGGAVCIRYAQTNTQITNCTFTSNTSESVAGAIYVRDGAAPVIDNCTFNSNRTATFGAGIYTNASNPTIKNCEFTQNTGGTGSGIRNENSDSTIEDCVFVNNGGVSGAIAAEDGGAIYSNDSACKIVSCVFIGNDVNASGGAVNMDDTTELVNCLFIDNSSNDGGGIFCRADTPKIINCTFTGNTAVNGNAIAAGAVVGTSVELINSVLWDGGSEISDSGSFITVSYCDVQSGYAGTGNIDQDPSFIDADGADDILGTIDDNCRLSDTSPCVDVGDNTAIPAYISTDLDGAYRVAGSIVDMGAYEVAGCGDENHSIPTGDFDGDCKVDLSDFAVFAQNWLVCNAPECD
jgi:predicted outer membrane repeat protein